MSKMDQAAMDELLAQARREGKWLRCAYQDLWFEPDELEGYQRAGQFRWGVCNWTLRDPAERRAMLQQALTEAKEDLRRHDRRVFAIQRRATSK